MMRKNHTIFLILMLTCWNLSAQQLVLPHLVGTELRTATVAAYKPGVILDYSHARDSMFRRVYAKNDSLSCVYTGHKLYMNPALDPTDAVYLNGIADGINTEHTWPQSYGASIGNARSDMYHLFPTRSAVNQARESFPFGEIPDNQTDRWFYLNQTSNNVPGANKDLYSEVKANLFEPREDFKGDIARAMFYFYTIYNNEAAAAPAGFFENQINTLYAWHLLDPADAEEWQRNNKIAVFQENKKNPYILDSTMVRRAFCLELGLPCSPITSTTQTAALRPSFLQSYPNPFLQSNTISYHLPAKGRVQVTIFNSQGAIMKTLIAEKQAAGDHQIQWSANGEQWPAGLYFARLDWSNGKEQYQLTQKLLRQ